MGGKDPKPKPPLITFSLTKKVWENIVNHCQHEFPYESCGLLSGNNGVVETIWKMKNINRSPVSFAMDPGQIDIVFKLIAQKNEVLLGIYHSHPTEQAFPSKIDIAHNNYSEVNHLIISLLYKIPIVKCFQIKGSRVTEIPIEVKD